MSKTESMPPLPAGAVDFNALHDAIAAGASPEAAIEKATPRKPKADSAKPAAAPAAPPKPIAAPAKDAAKPGEAK